MQPPCFVISFFSLMLSHASHMSRASHSLEHNQYLQTRWERCEVGTRVMVMFRDGKRWKKYRCTITFRPSGITSKYGVKFEGEDDRIWKVKMLSIFENQETCGIVSIGWEDDEEDDDDDDDTEAIDQEEDHVPMEEEEEDNTEASEATSDQGDQIGEFWSGINYKVDKYTVRVVGLVDGNYWVQQWQPKKLEFKGGRWSKPASCIKVKK
jgi:hypothetical protein